MHRWQKDLETATNIAIILACFAVAALATRRFFERPHIPHGPKVGVSISVPGINWRASSVNLVMALSTVCHFCSESAGFYKRLIPTAEGNGVGVFAVFPQALSDDQAYLKGLGLIVPKVFEQSLDSLGISGTPTLLLLDSKGTIKRVWIGKLDQTSERDLLSSLQK